MRTFEIRADIYNNILYFILEGNFICDEIVAAKYIVLSEINKLKHGFLAVFNIDKLIYSNSECESEINTIRSLILRKGARKVENIRLNTTVPV